MRYNDYIFVNYMHAQIFKQSLSLCISVVCVGGGSEESMMGQTDKP